MRPVLASLSPLFLRPPFCCTATLDCTVINRPPASPDLFYYVIAGAPLVRSAAQGLLSKATDPDGDAVSINGYTSPAHGLLSGVNLNTGAFSFTPTAGYVGTDSFTFNLKDARGQNVLVTVTLDIREQQGTAA